MNQKTEKITVYLLFVLCLTLRVVFISQKNLWFDEVFSWHLSLESFYTIIVQTANDIHPPLFYFLLKIWNYVFGDSVTSMRFLSAVLTSSSVFFLYPISRRYLDFNNSVFVLMLYIVSPLNIYYSQEVRMAGMNLFWNIGSAFFLLKLMDKPHNYHRIFKDRYSILFVIFTAAGIYTHYFSFFILAGELLFIIYSYLKTPKRIIPFIILFTAIFILYLFWIPDFITHINRGQSWRSPQRLYDVLHEYVNFIRDLNLGLYYYYTDLKIVGYITYFSAIAVILAFTGIFFKNIENNEKPILLIFLLFIPLILAGIISFKQRIEFYRYLSILVPYYSFFIVYGLNKWGRKYIFYPILMLLLIVNIYGMRIHYSFNFKNDDYRDLIKRINREYLTGDRIYVEPNYNGWVINYYKKQNKINITDPVYLRYGWNELMDSLNTQKPERFWLVMDYSSIDTLDYHNRISNMKQNFTLDEMTTYFLAPSKVELYRFIKTK
ncbi:MAG: glycosyltransferase family 39 protein [Ignavibacteria bacterium]|nr:glycosyltransferase family 39 protein [Ignavibacteria bacterium]